jgi:hypothetical protein
MHSTEFAGCCGARIFHDLNYTPELHAEKARLRRKLLLAITSQSQAAACTALKKEGFTPHLEFVNPNSGNTLTLWTFADPQQLKPKMLLPAPVPAVDDHGLVAAIQAIAAESMGRLFAAKPAAKAPAKKVAARKAPAKRRA